MVKTYIKKDAYKAFIIKGKKVILYLNPKEYYDSYDCDEYSFVLDGLNIKDSLISFLIKCNYPSDRMDAIRNNYELVKDGTAGDKTAEYTQEYLVMQDWRAYSKELATEIMNAKENVT